MSAAPDWAVLAESRCIVGQRLAILHDSFAARLQLSGLLAAGFTSV